MRTSRPAHGGRPHARRWLGSILAALALAVLAAGPAAAQATAAQVAEKLTQDPVYLDPGAEAKIDADQVRQRVMDAGTPIYIAILPASARSGYGGSVTELGKAIANELQRNGTYMVISGNQWAAGTYGNTIPRGEASRLASTAVDDHKNNPQAAVLQWVDGVAAASRGEPADQSGGGGGGVGVGAIAVLALLVVGGGALLFGARGGRP
jgi:hypothetical protein